MLFACGLATRSTSHRSSSMIFPTRGSSPAGFTRVVTTYGPWIRLDCILIRQVQSLPVGDSKTAILLSSRQVYKACINCNWMSYGVNGWWKLCSMVRKGRKAGPVLQLCGEREKGICICLEEYWTMTLSHIC